MMGDTTPISDEIREDVIRWSALGMTAQSLAEEHGISTKTVYRIRNQAKGKVQFAEDQTQLMEWNTELHKQGYMTLGAWFLLLVPHEGPSDSLAFSMALAWANTCCAKESKKVICNRKAYDYYNAESMIKIIRGLCLPAEDATKLITTIERNK